MSGRSLMTEIIPGFLIGNTNGVENMVKARVDVLVPLDHLDGRIWRTPFRGEVLYYPIEEKGVLPDDMLHELVDKICDRLDEEKQVGVFCTSGYGRTGYVAGCVLAKRGIKDPVGYLCREYSPEAIETERQTEKVFTYARSLRAQEINTTGLGENFFEYKNYCGSLPYIYLSFSEWDYDIAAATVRILNESGYNVAYDRSTLGCQLWSGDKQNAIEDCSVFMTIETPCERVSHIRYTERCFAELLEKPTIYIETNRHSWKYMEKEDDYVASDPSEPDFGEKCLDALKHLGFMPSSERPDPAEDKPVRYVYGKKDVKERSWDLGIVYAENYGSGSGPGANHRICNLRTRETVDSHGVELEKPSEEDLYRAIGWLLVEYKLLPRSSNKSYFMNMIDTSFSRTLINLGGKPSPEIAAEYDAKWKRIREALSNYPYMDEFEYIDSQFD